MDTLIRKLYYSVRSPYGVNAALGTVVVLILPAFFLASPATAAGCPVVRTSIGDQEIDPSQTHDVFVWIERYPHSGDLPKQVNLVFNNSRFTTVDRTDLMLEMPGAPVEGTSASGKHELIKLSFSKEAKGLATLMGRLTSLEPECSSFEQVINIGGFAGMAKLTTNLVPVESATGSRVPFTGGDIKPFGIFIKDNADQPFRLGATITFMVTAPPGAQLSKGDGKWAPQIPITGDGRRLGDLQLKLPERGAEKNARLVINGILGGTGASSVNDRQASSILDADIVFDYQYVWWIRLFSIIVGALCYSLVEAVTSKRLGEFSWTSFGWKISLLCLIGILAFLVEDTKILGFDVDKTTIKGNILFGVLVGCLGLDGIINRVQEFIHKT